MLARFNDTLELVEIVARQVSRAVGSSIELGGSLEFRARRIARCRSSLRRGARRAISSVCQFRVRGAIIDGVRVMGRLPRRAHERLRGLEAASRTSEGALEDVHARQPPGSGRRTRRTEPGRALGGDGDRDGGGSRWPSTGAAKKGELVGVAAALDPEAQTAAAELIEPGARRDRRPARAGVRAREPPLSGGRTLRSGREGSSVSASRWASRLHTRAIGRSDQAPARSGRLTIVRSFTSGETPPMVGRERGDGDRRRFAAPWLALR